MSVYCVEILNCFCQDGVKDPSVDATLTAFLTLHLKKPLKYDKLPVN